MTTVMTSNPDLRAIEELLYEEASLLDRPDLDRWIELYTEDGTYWMPASEDQPDPLNHISHFYDDRVLMEIRKRNFVHPRAASKDHKVRCSHVIGNVRIAGRDQAAGTLTVTSNFHALVFYRGEQRIYGGDYVHELVDTKDGLRIRRKRVNLVNCEAPQRSLIIYL